MKTTIKKITNSIIPVILLLASIFLILLFVEFRASQNADKAQYIHITKESKTKDTVDKEIKEAIE